MDCIWLQPFFVSGTWLLLVPLALTDLAADLPKALKEIRLSRKPPPFPDSLRSQNLAATAIGSSYTIDVITPLFGGGVEPPGNDEITPIRVSSIRGHLRFWWRATRGAQFEKASDLAKEEGKIWGTTSEPSRVDVTVTTGIHHESKSSRDLLNEGSLGYALFPFREQEPLPQHIPTMQFVLNLRHAEDIATDVRAAVWAWVNFGGIGARTRRGCGALFCREMAPKSIQGLDKWLQAAKREFALAKQPQRDWPTFAAVNALRRTDTPHGAWKQVIRLFYEFRQGEIARGERTRGGRGRTRWPEADSLRAVAGKNYLPSTSLKNLDSDPAFPRARLGLPIVFHFKDSQDLFELYPAEKDSSRMASPIILRPLAVGSNSNAVPMIVRLRTRGHRSLKFSYAEGKDGEKREFGPFGEQAITRPNLATYEGSPMADLSEKGSSLVAFFKLAEQEGFKELK